MNKHLHRVIFNPSRGIRMVVQESAASAGKARSGSTQTGHAPGPVAAAFALLLTAQSSFAQIAADPGAGAHQRPNVLQAANGVPLVNIQTPSANGVSRNTYQQFDIGRQGAILNNSRTNTQTQIGGWVQGNPWLAGGSARVIVNEVNSATQSRLMGPLEVAGQRADVVIANPAGLVVDGLTLINAAGVTLAAGHPRYGANGSLDGFGVQAGTIHIQGSGMDATQADYANILARAISVNAGLWARDLRVVTGVNQTDAAASVLQSTAETSGKPQFALDVAHLGGMYAGKIFIVGTEAGLGVRNAGQWVADSTLSLSADGELINTGDVRAAQKVNIASQALRNSGNIAATGSAGVLKLDTAGDIANAIDGKGGVLEAAQLLIQSGSDIDNRAGTIRQTGHAALDMAAQSLSNTRQGLIGSEPLTGPGDGAGQPSHPPASEPTAPTGSSGENAGAGTGADAGVDAGAPAGDSRITARGSIRNDAGRIYTAGAAHLQVESLDNQGGSLELQSLGIRHGDLNNAGGRLQVAGELNASIGQLDNTQGSIRAARIGLDATSGILNREGSIVAQGNAQAPASAAIQSGGSIGNQGGTIGSVGELRIGSREQLDNQGGSISGNAGLTLDADGLLNAGGHIESAQGHVRLTAAKDIDNTQGHILAAEDLSLQARRIANDGGIRAGRDMQVTVSHMAQGAQGSTTAGNDLTITIQSLQSSGVLGAGVRDDGSLASSGNLRVVSQGSLIAQGHNLAGNRLDLEGAAIDLAGSQTAARDVGITASAADVVTDAATISAAESLAIQARQSGTQALRNQGGQLSAQAITLDVANLDNTQGGEIVQTGTADQRIELSHPQGILNNAGGRIASNAGSLSLSGGQVLNQGGRIEHAATDGSLALRGGDYLGDQGLLASSGRLDTRMQGRLSNDGGQISATQLALEAASISNRQGSILHLGTDAARIAATQGGLDNGHGRIASNASALTLSAAGVLDNTYGSIEQSSATRTAQAAVTAAALQGDDGKVLIDGALTLDIAGHVSHARAQLAAQDIGIHAQSLDNASGTVSAQGTLTANVAHALANQGGKIVAKGNAAVQAASADNTDGLIASAVGDAALRLNGPLTNTRGTVQSANALEISAAGINNAQGHIVGQSLGIDAHGGPLHNQQGTIAASGSNASLHIQSGALDNNAGLIQSQGTLGIDTQGQLLRNTASGQAGGILAAGALDIASGAIDNSAGFIGADDAVHLQLSGIAATSSLLNAAGRVAAASTLTIDAAQGELSNASGQLQSLGDLGIHANGSLLNNDSGLIRSAATATIAAARLVNTNTQAGEHGIEARDIRLTAPRIDNARGRIVANADADIAASTALDNAQGLVSAGQKLTINASPGNAASGMHLGNQGGTLVGGHSVSVNTGSMDGAGSIQSGGGMRLQTQQDLVNHSRIQANGDLQWVTSGNVVNHGVLNAAGSLTVSGRNVENHASAEMTSGAVTHVTANGTLTNRGLIDGAQTRIDAGTLDNAGGGRIYGDWLSIAAGNLYNHAEAGRAGSIAARGRLDIAAQQLVNEDGALIYSDGAMAIGGALDASRTAVGSAALVRNAAASIESGADMSIAAYRLENLNKGFSARTETKTESVNETYVYNAWNFDVPRYLPSEMGSCFKCGDRNDPGHDSINRLEYVTPSERYPFEAGYQRHPYILSGGSTGVFGQQKNYAQDDPVWALFNVPYGDIQLLNQRLTEYNSDLMDRSSRAHTIVYVTQRETTQTVVDNAGTAGTIRSGGNMSLHIGSGINDNSQVIAGSALSIQGGTLANQETVGSRTIKDLGTWIGHGVKYKGYRINYGEGGSDSYAQTITDETIHLNIGAIREYASATPWNPVNGRAGGGTAAVSTAQAGAASATVGTSPADRQDVAAHQHSATAAQGSQPDAAGTGAQAGNTTQAATGSTAVVRTTGAAAALPTASLFGLMPQSGVGHLVETDPRFADYRQWMSSDYMLSLLGLDPALTQKRLGDGFYEQKLIREQVAQLTGRRFLEGYASDEEQYAALMNAGATFAQAHSLRPGVALSAEQIAQLTSDIVWLVEQSVTLPDGSVQRVLVPQVYARVQPGDLDGSGALLAGQTLDIRLSGDFSNAGGTIAGRDVARITAENIGNLQGRITGNAVALDARQDIDNIGGQIDAAQTLLAQAGRDIRSETTTRTSVNQAGQSSFARTGVDRIAGLYVTGAQDGVLVASAGRDINLVGSIIDNASASSVGGQTRLAAGRDVHLSTVTTSQQDNLIASSQNYARTGHSTEVGSRITGAADTAIQAGRDINARAATVDIDGALALSAGRDVNIAAGQAQSHLDELHTSKSRRTFSRSTHVSANTAERTTAVASILSADTITIQAGHDVNVTGSGVISDHGTALRAGNDVRIAAATETTEETHYRHSSKSGLFGSSGGFTIGSQKQSANQAVARTTTAASTVESVNGDLSIQAGRDIAIEGSEVNALQQTRLSAGRDVTIAAAGTTESGASSQASKGSGIGFNKDGLGYSKNSQSGNGSYADTSLTASSVSGGDVLVSAGRDVRVQASTVVADEDVRIQAGRDVLIVAGTRTSSSAQASQSSGTSLNLVPSGLGKEVTLYSNTRNAQDGTGDGTHAVASTVGSLGGDVHIRAGQGYAQTGSDVVAPKGDITIQAQTVEITEARESGADAWNQSTSSTTIGARPRNAVVDLVMAAKNTVDTAQATASTGNGRVQALGAAATALSAYNTAQAAMALAQNPAQAAAVSIEVQVGHSKSQSSDARTSDSGRGSHVSAGGNVTIVASGAGTGSDIHVRGSEIQAGNDVRLKAEGDVLLESSQDKATLHSSNQSSGASIGVGFSLGSSNGITINASAYRATGEANGDDLIQQNTHVVAGNSVTIQSGADTTLAGATVTAPTVKADVGGNLTIESRQDVSTYESEQRSSGGGVSLCIPPICYGASSFSVAAGASDIDSHYQSVGEQSGIRAGDGGFEVNVKGDTTLTGGAITSTQAAIDNDANRFQTGGQLTLSDIENHARYEGDAFEINATFAGTPEGQKVPEGHERRVQHVAPVTGGSAGIGEDSGSASSVTTAGISGIAGNEAMRTGDAETGVKPIFDEERVQRELDAQVRVTAEFGRQASRAAGTYADQQAVAARMAGNEAEAQKWDEGGEYRTMLHAGIGALTGGVQGAAGAALSAAALPEIGERLASMNLPDAVRDALSMTVGTALGAVGGTSGAAAGLNQAANNYVSHSPFREVRQTASRENARLMNECGADCTLADFQRIDRQVAQVERAANLAAIGQVSAMTPQQAEQLSQLILELAPVYGSGESVLQLITGRSSLTGEEASRFWAAVGMVPVAGGMIARVGRTAVDVARALNAADAAHDVSRTGLINDANKLFRQYADDIETQTGYRLGASQREALANELRTGDHAVTLTPAENAALRREFNNSRPRLIAEWEANTGQKWPSALIDGQLITAQAHHIIPVTNAGPTSWWNITPAFRPDHTAIHRGSGPLNQLQSGSR